MGYLGGDRMTYKRMDLPLIVDGELKHVKPDFCIVDKPESQKEILLVAQEHKMTGGLDIARIQLVAGAVAAFIHNNLQRKKAGLLPLAKKAGQFRECAHSFLSFLS